MQSEAKIKKKQQPFLDYDNIILHALHSFSIILYSLLSNLEIKLQMNINLAQWLKKKIYLCIFEAEVKRGTNFIIYWAVV